MNSIMNSIRISYFRLSKGVSSAKIKQDLVHLIERPHIHHSDPAIENQNQMTLSRLNLFRQCNQSKKRSSNEELIEHFIHPMKFLYCSVHAYHERKFKSLWFRPEVTK